MKLQAVGSLLLATLITGCATPPHAATAEVQDPAYQSLLKSARNIEQSLTLLSEAEQFEKMKQNPTQPRVFKQISGMEQVVTMPWSGTLEQAVTKLANYSGYDPKFIGKPPALPILVQIGREPATVSDHMRNLGIQAGTRADLIVDPRHKVVEVRYGNGGI
ncbi:DotD/TraH family lipoprotein [Chromobacterium haemolyticum]|uniref:DotD/TraH family lipoprotein n=1 Tax=Chromobacterium haemolyticum TaxID=394935 RepID=UPI0024498A72|nr:DotD/TraH family lipoprotein [Chromobacterium haemolyticum]MDH0341973.1 DotD/TraH family lipoprotein [Chromobacterium haemolyticum]